MLGRIEQRITHHLQASQHGLQWLLKKPLTTLMTIVVIGLTLTLPVLFWVLIDNLHTVTQDWQRSGHILLYLTPASSVNEQSRLLVRVRETPGVLEATLKTPEEGLLELQHQAGMQEAMRYLPNNPLPPVMDVTPTTDKNTVEGLTQLQQSLKAYPSVEEVEFDRQWINRLYTLLAVSTKAAQSLMVLLALAVVLIIGNTLRMAMYHRQEEIQVLRLLGAGPAYILRPFLYVGVFYGFSGSLIAMLLVNVMLMSVTIWVNQLASAYDVHYALLGLSFQHIGLLWLFSMGLGWLAAQLFVRFA